MITKLVSFDFDSTLVHTMEPEEGRKLWREAKGEDFPAPTGWWGKAESLDTEVFYHPLNLWVHKHYLTHRAEENTSVFLATGRLVKMKNEVEKILDQHDLKFDNIHCNDRGETLKFKIRLFEDKLKEFPNVTELVMYDDRHEHLVKFVEWGKLQKVKITIIDVIKKKQLL